MRNTITVGALVTILLPLLIPRAQAAGADCPAVMIRAGKLLVDDPLNTETWKQHWERAKGQFFPTGDHVVAQEIPEEHHHAGAGRLQPIRSGVMQVDFRLDDSPGIQFGLDYRDDAKKDHLLRVQVAPDRLAVRAGSGWGKTTSMKPVGKAVAVRVAPGEWHTGVVEFHKQEILVHLDGTLVFYGVAEAPLDVEKNRLALNANGTASFRNLRAWEGVPVLGWDSVKSGVVRKLPKAK
ncbi:MAG TPA: hypothetical protein PLU30_13255 [Verrucomicrobiae bacterium]|nr:hypothetical protein [Verrucomicrobiae bacterium]